MAIDQAHEQNNAYVKGDGGAVGLMDDTAALRRWSIAGPELSRLIQQFHTTVEGNDDANVKETHHEEYPSFQKVFTEQVKKVIEDMGNPFEEDSSDLIVLDTHDIMDSKVSDSLKSLESLGDTKFVEFVNRIKTPSMFYEPIKKNNIALFSRQCSPPLSKEKAAVQNMKEDCNLFSRLFISCQNRQCDLTDFFKHENQNSPPALAKNGQMH